MCPIRGARSFHSISRPRNRTPVRSRVLLPRHDGTDLAVRLPSYAARGSSGEDTRPGPTTSARMTSDRRSAASDAPSPVPRGGSPSRSQAPLISWVLPRLHRSGRRRRDRVCDTGPPSRGTQTETDIARRVGDGSQIECRAVGPRGDVGPRRRTRSTAYPERRSGSVTPAAASSRRSVARPATDGSRADTGRGPRNRDRRYLSVTRLPVGRTRPIEHCREPQERWREMALRLRVLAPAGYCMMDSMVGPSRLHLSRPGSPGRQRMSSAP